MRSNTWICVGIGLAACLIGASVAQAAPLYKMELVVDQTAGTWEVYAWDDHYHASGGATVDNFGLAGFAFRLSGDITQQVNMSPGAWTEASGKTGTTYTGYAGFVFVREPERDLPSTNGGNVAVSQDTAPDVSGMYAYHLAGLGQTGGTIDGRTGDPTPTYYVQPTFDAKLLIGQGTYSAGAGTPDFEVAAVNWYEEAPPAWGMANVGNGSAETLVTIAGDPGDDTTPPTVDLLAPGTNPHNGGQAWNEGDWPGEPQGWNNPGRALTMGMTADDASGIADILWEVSTPDAPDNWITLGQGASATSMDISIQWIIDNLLGGDPGLLPPEYQPTLGETPGPEYWYNVRVTATDGSSNANQSTDEGQFFVPEPTTMMLLGLGVLGAAIRRRRRA